MLDEPLGALDRTLREQLSRELRRILRDSRIPAIYVTHDQEEAFAIADRLLLLHNGVILQTGKPHEFFHHPRNVWVAEFFGLGNIITGQVSSHAPLQVNTPLGPISTHCDHTPPPIGARAALLFRPVHARRDASSCPNKITGKVIDQVFQGEHYRITLRVNENISLFNILLSEPESIGAVLTVGYQSEVVLCLENGNGTR